MLVRDYMSTPVITIDPETGVQEALQLMRQHKIRRLPIVNTSGALVGIISERDLLYASPSPATSLSIWELNYLLARLEVKEIMTRNVIVTAPDAPLTETARLMLQNKIGGLPVVTENHVTGIHKVVGIITESDIFQAFLDISTTRSTPLREEGEVL
jgi:acetoin utilization protein AcuB